MKFRKKPVVIEAQQLTKANKKALAEWCDGFPHLEGVDIQTREGTMRADLGDWIICGVKGEFYPCKPDIFEQTYEPA